MRIGFSATCGFDSIKDVIKFGIENGFNAAEVNLNIPEFFPDRYSKSDREHIKAMAEDNDFSITFHGPEDINLCSCQNKLVKASVDILKECMDFACELGGKRFTFHAGSSVEFTMVDKNIRLEDCYPSKYVRILEDSIKDMVDYNDGRITLCAENAGYFSGTKAMAFEHFLGNGLYLTWDIGHSHINKVQMDFMMKNMRFVRNVHVHDVLKGRDHRIIGTGEVNIPYYMSLMDERDVCFIIEVRPANKAAESLNNLKALLKMEQTVK